MTAIQQEVIEKLQALPAEKQQEVLNFVNSLQSDKEVKKPPRSSKGVLSLKEKAVDSNSFLDSTGMFAHLGVTITDDELSQARREMWANFPRDIEL